MNTIIVRPAMGLVSLLLATSAIAQDQSKGYIKRLSASASGGNYEVVIGSLGEEGEEGEERAYGNVGTRLQSLAELAFRNNSRIGFLAEKDNLTLLSIPRDAGEWPRAPSGNPHSNVSVVGLISRAEYGEAQLRLENNAKVSVRIDATHVQRIIENAFELQRPLASLKVDEEGRAIMANSTSNPQPKAD